MPGWVARPYLWVPGPHYPMESLRCNRHLPRWSRGIPDTTSLWTVGRGRRGSVSRLPCEIDVTTTTEAWLRPARLKTHLIPHKLACASWVAMYRCVGQALPHRPPGNTARVVYGVSLSRQIPKSVPASPLLCPCRLRPTTREPAAMVMVADNEAEALEHASTNQPPSGSRDGPCQSLVLGVKM